MGAPIHNGLFAPIPCGGDRPKKCTGTSPAPLCWPWTTDRPISRFSFLTLRDGREAIWLTPAAGHDEAALRLVAVRGDLLGTERVELVP